MAGFVNFCVQNAGIHWPWNLQGLMPGTPVISHADISAAGGPLDQWAALPSAAKLQILFVIGMLEFWGESSYALEAAGQKHVRGGKPGYYPSFAPLRGSGLGQPTLDLFDPFGLQKKMTPEQKGAASLLSSTTASRRSASSAWCPPPRAASCPASTARPRQYAGEPMAYWRGQRTCRSSRPCSTSRCRGCSKVGAARPTR